MYQSILEIQKNIYMHTLCKVHDIEQYLGMSVSSGTLYVYLGWEKGKNLKKKYAI